MAQNDLLTRGVVEVIEKDHLEKAFASGKKLRIKYGADPTAPDLHLGHSVALRKLKEFQDQGHTIVFIIGDYTARIGDPTDRSKARPMLSEQEVKANAKTYFKQVGKILNAKKIEIRYNSEWFRKLDLASLIKLMAEFTVQRILERDDFTKRLKSGTEVHSHEVLYPIMQAYDSIIVEADVELGGTDQKFNMLAGRDLQRHRGLPQQDVITVPLLVGTDGVKKMSKSVGNYIGLTDEPNEMFRKVMSVNDDLIDQYFTLCTDAKRPTEDPREAKLALAKTIVGMYHDAKAAAAAEDEFVRVVSNKEIPSDIERKKLKVKSLSLTDLLLETGMAASKSEARRLIEQGGVKLDGERQTEPMRTVALGGEIVLQVGKHKFLKISA
ncbi:tyrosine--tRNA ligase [Patescibacteria group bacterium]|nr:tyrosine--tRNA ligase [Patescibacteria group bacterium]